MAIVRGTHSAPHRRPVVRLAIDSARTRFAAASSKPYANRSGQVRAGVKMLRPVDGFPEAATAPWLRGEGKYAAFAPAPCEHPSALGRVAVGLPLHTGLVSGEGARRTEFSWRRGGVSDDHLHDAGADRLSILIPPRVTVGALDTSLSAGPVDTREAAPASLFLSRAGLAAVGR